MTEIMEKAAIDFILDRSSWEPVKFGDVAIQQKQSVDRENTSITRYVKGEHMGSEDFHLREWGELKDEYLGPAFIRRFEAGDILYGSRRTYLKKVVVAPFEGITANTTFVIKANTDIIDERLLPFVMLSEGFTEHSIRNSKGSVNPYINWKDIANYEFLLPPKDQQAELAELLWAMDVVIEKESRVLMCLKQFYQTAIHNYTLGKVRLAPALINDKYKDSKLGEIPIDWDIAKLSDHSSLITNGFVGTATPYYTSEHTGVKYLQGKNIRRNQVDLRGLIYITEEFHIKQKKTQLKEGDLLTVQSGHIGETAVLPHTLEGANCHAIIITRLYKDKFNPQYVSYFMNSLKGQVKIAGITVGTTVAHVNTSELKKFLVPKPSLSEQNLIVGRLKLIGDNIRKNQLSIADSQSLQKSITNQVFS